VQVLLHGGHKLRPAAGAVEIVVAQEERAARGASALRGDGERFRMTGVEQAGG
jgi:hypothetical protein